MRSMISDHSQEVLQKELSQAATQGDGSPRVQQVSDQFRGGNGCVEASMKAK